MEFRGHRTNQACHKSGIMSPEYHPKSLNPLIQPQAILELHRKLFSLLLR
jgi:hypothetical protein